MLKAPTVKTLDVQDLCSHGYRQTLDYDHASKHSQTHAHTHTHTHALRHTHTHTLRHTHTHTHTVQPTLVYTGKRSLPILPGSHVKQSWPGNSMRSN